MLKNTVRKYNYWVGVVLAALGGLALSTGGLFVRMVETATAWEVLIYRSGSLAALLLLIVSFQHRRQTFNVFAKMHYRGLIASTCLAISFISYIYAIKHSTVANVMFILASTPVLSALIARVAISEVPSPLIWYVAGGIAVGIFVMVNDSLTTSNLDGTLSAIVSALTLSISIVMFRGERTTNMLPSTCLAGVFACVISALIADQVVIGLHDLAVSVLLGTVQSGIGFICLTYAPRYLRASETSLISLIEPALSPIWVWLAFNEVPSGATLMGGTIVVALVILYIAHTSSET